MTNPGTTTNHSIRLHSVHIPVGGAGPVGHQVHQVGGSKSGGQRGMGLVGVDGGDDVGSDPIPTPTLTGIVKPQHQPIPPWFSLISEYLEPQSA